ASEARGNLRRQPVVDERHVRVCDATNDKRSLHVPQRFFVLYLGWIAAELCFHVLFRAVRPVAERDDASDRLQQRLLAIRRGRYCKRNRPCPTHVDCIEPGWWQCYSESAGRNLF